MIQILLLNFIRIMAFNNNEFNLVLYNRQMRYQIKPYRSISYTHQQLIRDKDTKENKENNNISNLPISKPTRVPKDYDLNPCKLKLQQKISQNTDCTVPLTSRRSVGSELRDVYTQLICKDYSQDILSHLCQSSTRQSDFLSKHQIGSSLRSKMVDWMIEVLSSYKMSEQTFFRSVYLMDAYLKHQNVQLQVKDLHLIGVTSMFTAAKYEEIHPLKLSVVHDKISRKKFKKSQILQKESQMIQILGFKLETPSVYDIARHALKELNPIFSQQSTKYLSKILLYLSKMVLFNSELAEESQQLLAAGVLFISLKTLEQVDSSADPQKRLPQICTLLFSEQEKVIEVSRKILDLAKNYSKYYPSLTNLKKFNKFEYGEN